MTQEIETVGFDKKTNWETRDGEIIPIREMSDQHLVNTIHYLNRRHEGYLNLVMLQGPPMFRGEMAQWAAEQEWLSLADSDPRDLWPAYETLLGEANKRGIEIKTC